MDVKHVLAFCGFKATGKSFMAAHLAQKLGLTCLDLDKKHEEVYQKPVREVFKDLGKNEFYESEYRILENLDLSYPCFLALGGGTLLNEKSWAFIKTQAEIIYLKTDVSILKQRILSETTLWPLIDSSDAEKSLHQLYMQRESFYKSLNLETFDLSQQTQIDQLELYARKFFRRFI